ncbi:hypothetical protein TIFTF001_000785 [Ficus carica]|uniref:Uncharacterized protein n=1 Tax=Ficus carica TaxID=3494 RepID=A0AA87Z497_FICCA|nr:hypothetical protein TIFTF001_000785 [Ficus carica]
MKKWQEGDGDLNGEILSDHAGWGGARGPAVEVLGGAVVGGVLVGRGWPPEGDFGGGVAAWEKAISYGGRRGSGADGC